MRSAPLAAILGLSLLGAWLAACRPAPLAAPTSVLTPLPPATTVVVLTTAPPTATAARPPATPTRRAATAVATMAPSATPVIAVTAEPCVNDLVFVADLTVPDGAQFLPGQTFVKKWSVRNTGACDWGPGYRLVFINGDPLTAAPGLPAQTEYALYPARAGTTAVWEIPMRAPEVPGEYTGRWQARDPQGNFFGNLVFIKIEVIALPVTDTPTP